MYSLSLIFTFAFGLLALPVHGYLVITGATGGVNTQTGERPQRKEINTFKKSGPAWDLYLQCLAQIQSRPQDQIDSWFQIAGIHGRPFMSWDGAPRAAGQHYEGYCPHGSALFPTWHRPYLALLEQTIWKCAQDLAKKYPTSTRANYVKDAVTLRIPYWDWAKTAALPDVVKLERIDVNTPTGKQSIKNPLYSYTFHPKPGTSVFPTSDAPARYASTVRSPKNGVSDHKSIDDALKKNAGYLHDITYLILTRDTNYAEFSNNAYAGKMTGYGSIENPHGAVHNYLGGENGHMTFLDYSAFDPIFWLHHTNVDRLIAIWQALNPNSFNINQKNNAGTYSLPAGTVETASTTLPPFHIKADGTRYNSNTARYTRTFGYTYPEVLDWGKTPSQLTAAVKAQVRTLYDPKGALGRRRRNVEKRDTPAGETPPLDVAPVVQNGVYRNWQINIRANKYELDSSYTVYTFFGDAPADPSDWAAATNLAGAFPVLRSAGNPTGGPMTVYGVLPLTRKLLDDIDVDATHNLLPVTVEPYLKKKLNWRVAKVTGEQVDLKTLPNLKVYVVDQVVTPPKTSTDFPIYGAMTPHLNVTSGKPGAATEADGLV